VIDATGCDPARLRDVRGLAALFEALVVSMGLKVVGTAQWHQFPEPGGVTGLALLSESHLTLHTFPEHGFAALNVYCCRTRTPADFAELLSRHLGATGCSVRELPRGGLR